MKRTRRSLVNASGRVPGRELTQPMLDQLEPRMVLASVDIAAVGLSYHVNLNGDFFVSESRRSYVMEGTVADSGVFSYFMRWDGAGGPLAPSPTRTAEVRLRDEGEFDYQSPRWPGLSSEWGSQFLPQDGYSVGWWRAFTEQYLGSDRNPTTTHTEQQLIVPLAALNTPMTAVRGGWAFSMIERDPITSVTTTRTGTLNILQQVEARDIVRFAEAGTGETISQSRVNSGTGSRFGTDAGLRFYLSSDGATLIFADLARADGTIAIGYAIRTHTEIAPEEAAGTYLMMANQGSERSHERTLMLNADGTYRVAEGALWTGTPSAPDNGTWFVHDGREIVLRPSNGAPEDRFMLSTSGAALMLATTSRPTTPFAIATRATTDPVRSEPVHAISSMGAAGEALVFIDRTNAQWTVADVVAESAGPETTGPMVSWFDKATGLVRAAANTDRGVTIYSENADGTWSYTVLGEELGTGTVLVGSLAHTPGPGGRINLFGLSATGDLIRYVEGLDTADWSEWNLSTLRLDPLGLATPDFAGTLVAYATPWGGLNVAGLDTGGDLQTVWTTTRADRWFVSNLSENADAPPLVGDLAVAAAGPAGIYFSGVDADGHVQVLSWRPDDVGWTATALSAVAMDASTITMTFDRATARLYVVAIAQASVVSLITINPSDMDALPQYTPVYPPETPTERRISDNLEIRLGNDGLISITGLNEDADTVRYTAEWSQTPFWTFQNLTEIAV